MTTDQIRYIDQSVERLGDGYFHYRTVLILGLGNAADAVELLSIGYILAVYDHGQLSGFDKGLLTAAAFIGMLVGGLVLGGLSDRIGRRPTLIFSLALNGFSALFASISWSVYSFVFFRFLAGLGVGGSVPSLFTLCAEHLPVHRRGAYIAVVASFWMVGSIFTAGLAWILLDDPEHAPWRIFAALTSIPALTSLIFTIVYIPESARHLAVTNNFDEALHVLSMISAVNGDELQPLLTGTNWIEATIDDSSPPKPLQSVKSLFDPCLRSTTVILLLSWFCLSFGSYGIATWITVLFKGIGLADPFGNAFLYAAANLPGNIASTLLVDVVGRKWLLSVSMLFASISAILFAVATAYHSPIAIVTLACCFNAFSISGWNALDILSAESFPTDLRTSAMGILSASGRIGSIVAQLINGFLIGPPVHVQALLSITSAMMLVGGSSAMFLSQETSGILLPNTVSELKSKAEKRSTGTSSL